MRRKITKNKHQYKMTIPVELVRKLEWDDKKEISFHLVSSPLGNGLLIVEEDKNKVMEMEFKK